MASSVVHLSAESKYGYSGQYIAKLTGRDPSRVQFKREFCGSKSGKRQECTFYDTDESGLFEICDVGKHGKSKTFVLVLPWEDGLKKVTSDLEDALKIAKRLDSGETLTDIVALEHGDAVTQTEWYGCCSVCERELATGEACPEHPDDRVSRSRQVPKLSEDGTPIHVLVYDIKSKSEVKKEAAASTLDAAVAGVVALLSALPMPLQRKALTAVRSQLFPKADDSNG